MLLLFILGSLLTIGSTLGEKDHSLQNAGLVSQMEKVHMKIASKHRFTSRLGARDAFTDGCLRTNDGNLVLNGGFEDKSEPGFDHFSVKMGTTWAGWNVFGSNDFANILRTPAYNAMNQQTIHLHWGCGSGVGGISQIVLLQPQTSYTLKFFGSGGAWVAMPQTGYVTISTYNTCPSLPLSPKTLYTSPTTLGQGEVKLLQAPFVPTGTIQANSWTPFTFQFNTNALTQATKVRLDFTAGPNQCIQVDDITLTSSAPTADTVLDADTCGCCSDAIAPNYVRNGGFEEIQFKSFQTIDIYEIKTGVRWACWDILGSYTPDFGYMAAALTQPTYYAASGTQSMNLHWNCGIAGGISQNIVLPPKKNFVVSFSATRMFAGTDLQQGTVTVSAVNCNGKTQIFQQSFAPTAVIANSAKDWSSFKFQFNTNGYSSSTKFQLKFWAEAGSCINVDDISVAEGYLQQEAVFTDDDACGNPTGGNLVRNGGYENPQTPGYDHYSVKMGTTWSSWNVYGSNEYMSILRPPTYSPAAGTQTIHLHWGCGGGVGALSQVVRLQPQTSYRISFSGSSGNWYAMPQSGYVTISTITQCPSIPFSDSSLYTSPRTLASGETKLLEAKFTPDGVIQSKSWTRYTFPFNTNAFTVPTNVRLDFTSGPGQCIHVDNVALMANSGEISEVADSDIQGCCSTATANNLIRNGDFEEIQVKTFQASNTYMVKAGVRWGCWDVIGGFNPDFAFIASVLVSPAYPTPSGNQSWHMHWGCGSADPYGISQNVVLQPQKNYLLSFLSSRWDGYGFDRSGTVTIATIKCDGSTDMVILQQTFTPGGPITANDWTPFEFEFNTNSFANGGSFKAQIKFIAVGAGQCMQVDAIKLIEGKLPPRLVDDVCDQPQNGNIIRNGGFENPPRAGTDHFWIPNIETWSSWTITGSDINQFGTLLKLPTYRPLGQQAMQIQRDCPDNGALTQLVLLQPKTTYTLNFYGSASHLRTIPQVTTVTVSTNPFCPSSSDLAARTQISVPAANDPNVLFQSKWSPYGSAIANSWTRFTFQFNTDALNAATQARLDFHVGVGQCNSVDNVTLIADSGVSAVLDGDVQGCCSVATANNLVRNGDFEEVQIGKSTTFKVKSGVRLACWDVLGPYDSDIGQYSAILSAPAYPTPSGNQSWHFHWGCGSADAYGISQNIVLQPQKNYVLSFLSSRWDGYGFDHSGTVTIATIKCDGSSDVIILKQTFTPGGRMLDPSNDWNPFEYEFNTNSFTNGGSFKAQIKFWTEGGQCLQVDAIKLIEGTIPKFVDDVCNQPQNGNLIRNGGFENIQLTGALDHYYVRMVTTWSSWNVFGNSDFASILPYYPATNNFPLGNQAAHLHVGCGAGVGGISQVVLLQPQSSYILRFFGSWKWQIAPQMGHVMISTFNSCPLLPKTTYTSPPTLSIGEIALLRSSFLPYGSMQSKSWTRFTFQFNTNALTQPTKVRLDFTAGPNQCIQVDNVTLASAIPNGADSVLDADTCGCCSDPVAPNLVRNGGFEDIQVKTYQTLDFYEIKTGVRWACWDVVGLFTTDFGYTAAALSLPTYYPSSGSQSFHLQWGCGGKSGGITQRLTLQYQRSYTLSFNSTRYFAGTDNQYGTATITTIPDCLSSDASVVLLQQTFRPLEVIANVPKIWTPFIFPFDTLSLTGSSATLKAELKFWSNSGHCINIDDVAVLPVGPPPPSPVISSTAVPPPPPPVISSTVSPPPPVLTSTASPPPIDSSSTVSPPPPVLTSTASPPPIDLSSTSYQTISSTSSYTTTGTSPGCPNSHKLVVNPSPITIGSTNTAQFTLSASSIGTSSFTVLISGVNVKVSQCKLDFSSSMSQHTLSASFLQTATLSSSITVQIVSSSDASFASCPPIQIPVVPAPDNKYAAGECTSHGDPHYVSFDKKKFNYYKTGDYFLIRTDDANFLIQNRLKPCATVTCNHYTAVKHGKDVFMFKWEDGVQYAYKASSGTIEAGTTISRAPDSGEYVLSFADGIRVKVLLKKWGTRGYYTNVNVVIPGIYYSKTKGLCGTFDNNAANDFTTRPTGSSLTGTVVSDIQSFFNSWRVPDNENLFIDPNIQSFPRYDGLSISASAAISSECPINIPDPHSTADKQSVDITNIFINNIGTGSSTSYEIDFTENVDVAWDAELETLATEYCSMIITGVFHDECVKYGITETFLQESYDDCLLDTKISGVIDAATEAIETVRKTCVNQELTHLNVNVDPLMRCSCACHLHGKCGRGGCSCDAGRSGHDCRYKTTLLVMEHYRVGGRWIWVRHIPYFSSTWHPVNDNAKGTADAYGVYGDMLNPFSIAYSAFDYDEMLFATGDMQHFIIVDRDQIDNTNGLGYFQLRVKYSDIGANYTVGVYNRNTQPEDPWLSNRDHFVDGTNAQADSESHSMLYGENAYPGWLYWLQTHEGADVYIRNSKNEGVFTIRVY